jgi:hypothetical protein
MLPKERGPGTPNGFIEPSLNCSTPREGSGSPRVTTALHAQALADLRFQRGIAGLYRLGPRPLFEWFVKIGCERQPRYFLERKVRTYPQVDLRLIRALGADEFSPRTLRVVGSGLP